MRANFRWISLVILLVALAEPSFGVTSDALTTLGQKLFSDTRLSVDRKVSCATCHQSDHAFQDNRPTARGAFGQEGTHKTPSLLYVSGQKDLFWDGRRSSLGDQALDPLLNPREHGLKDVNTLRATVEAFSECGPMFDAANAQLGEPVDRRINQRALVKALAAFEARLTDGMSPFETFHYDGDGQAISAAAQDGCERFPIGAAGAARFCSGCRTR